MQEQCFLVHRYVSIAEPVLSAHFPSSAKLVLKLSKQFEQIEPTGRKPVPHFEEEDMLRLKHLHDTILWMNKNLDDIDREERNPTSRSKQVLL